MIIVDTNVVSELTRELPNGNVLRWLRMQSLKQLATTTVTLAELQLGLELLPIGQKRTVLSEKLAILLFRSFEDRILSFDIFRFFITVKINRVNYPVYLVSFKLVFVSSINESIFKTINDCVRIYLLNLQ